MEAHLPEENSGRQRLYQVWRWLLHTSVSSQDLENSRYARMMAALIAVLIPLTLIPGLIVPLISSPDIAIRNLNVLVTAPLAIIVLLIVFGVNRAGHYRLAAQLLTVVFLVAPYMVVLLSPGQQDLDGPLIGMAAMSVLLAGTLIRTWRAILITAFVASVEMIAVAVLTTQLAPPLVPTGLVTLCGIGAFTLLNDWQRVHLENDRRRTLQVALDRAEATNAELLKAIELANEATRMKSETEARQSALLSGLRAVIAITDELMTAPNSEVLFRRAVELTREKLGIERAAIFLEDEDNLMRGTYGTDMEGNTTDEHAATIPQSHGLTDQFLKLTANEQQWLLRDRERSYWKDDHIQPVGIGWNAVTRIHSGDRGIGVFFNDAAISHTAVDVTRQEVVAIFCSMLGKIIEQKRLEQTLRQSEERYRLLAENINDVIIRANPEGRYLYVSPSSRFVLGYEPTELVGQTTVQFIHPEDTALRQTALTELLEHRHSAAVTYRFRHKDGHYVWLEVSSRAVVSEQTGEVVEFVVSARDITERKHAQAALREQRDFLQQVIDNLPNLIIVKDRAGRFQLVNNFTAQIYSMMSGEMLGKTDADINPNQAEVDFFREKDRETLDAGHIVFIPEETVLNRYYQTSKIPLANREGQFDRLLVVGADITERKKAEDALQQALDKEKELSDLKSRFVSTASHQFRTPLAVILATTETLIRYRPRLTDEQIEQKFHQITDQVAHLKDIMDDLLLLARMQARRAEYNPVKLNLDSLCRSVLEEFQSQPEVTQHLVYTCNDPPWEGRLDPRLIRETMTNLVSNAIKYSPSGTDVSVDLELTAEMVILRVRDEGIGIPEADLKHVFEPFHRATNVGTISGTGLGLVIVKESVEAHGGSLSVESHVGVGTTFTISIPFRENADDDEVRN